ncbi:flagellar hook-length control protein FliK [Gilliamella sp. Pas-s25]|uniref:flagellar hook-length control protein FliK n=1 Tax=Gilliamella sp. Pas-s25 TaxID=2687310 RepID=UPI00135DAA72|nr:flagellar hook-length control protein FliK [Gilliamella sp. Pas-s25]MWP61880.1 hypothetical protein [Gilliamella sp. Pas-s25]
MNINLINDLNMTTSHQAKSVETDVMADDNDCFQQQLLRLSENQAEQGEKSVNAKSNVTEDEHEDNDFKDEVLMMSIYPINIQDLDQEKRALVSTAQNSDITTDFNALRTNNLNTHLFDHSSSETWANEQATQLLASIYDSEDLTKKVTQQTDVAFLSNDNVAHKKATSIKGGLNNLYVNQTNNTQDANNITQKLVTTQIQFIANHYDKDAAEHANQEFSLTTNVNGLSSLLSSSNTTATSTTINLSTPVNIAQWQTSLTEQIIMFNRQGIQTADIKLHPQELGSLHIKLAMNDDKMHLHMMAEHSVVKGMLESALPFLRTSLEDQGIMLEQANIGDFSMMNDSQQSAMHQHTKNNPLPTVQTLDVTDADVEQITVENRSHNSGLSIFA